MATVMLNAYAAKVLPAGKYGKPVGTTGLPKRLPDKALALLFEVLGAVSGTFAGTAFALKELFGAAYLQLRKATGLRQAA